MPFYGVLPQLEVDVPANLERIFALYGPGAEDVYRSSLLGREWIEPNGIKDCLVLTLLRQQDRFGMINLATDRHRGHITQSELHLFGLLAPHIRRAVTISDLFEIEKCRTDMLQALIDSMTVSVVIVGDDLVLQYANATAEDMMREATVFALSGNRVVFGNLRAHAAIRYAVALGQRNEVALGTEGIGIPLANVARPSIAHVLPLAGRRGLKLSDGRSAAAIFVTQAGNTIVPFIEAIAALFGLTAAEKRVISLVAKGLTRAEIAQASGVSDGTIKTQLAAIYDKTATSGQRELELLIRDLTPPVK